MPRPPRYQVRTQPRRRSENVKERIVVARQFTNVRLCSEDVAEFKYRPVACRKSYRLVVVRKNLAVEKGEQRLFTTAKDGNNDPLDVENNWWDHGPKNGTSLGVIIKGNHAITDPSQIPASIVDNAGLEKGFRSLLSWQPAG